MKVALLLACTCAVLSTKPAQSAAVQAPLNLISLEDLTESERKHLEYLDSRYYPRPKRSGSDLIGLLKESISNGIKSKISSIAKGSASAVSHFSSGSSGDSHGYHHHDIPEAYDHKSFDFWSLKKSILNTLLQAVKAIKGGVLAVNGQLIKGGGHLISAKGKLISSKGEALTTLGKNIASAALLSPHHDGHSASGHDEYSHFDHNVPTIEYGAPSAPGSEYQSPQHYHSPSHEENVPQGGILILKKIPNSGRGHHSSHDAEESKIPDFKPIEPSGPSFATIIGKFLKASTSLKPDEPAPFGHTATGHSASYSSSVHESDHHHEHYDHSDHHDKPHSHTVHTEHQHAFGGPSSSSHVIHHDSSSVDFLPPAPTQSSYDHVKPLTTSYGTPFEEAPSYVNLDEYTSASKKNPQIVSGTKSVKVLPAAGGNELQSHNYNNNNNVINPSISNDYLSPNFQSKPNLFISMNLPLNPSDSSHIESSFQSFPYSSKQSLPEFGNQNFGPTSMTLDSRSPLARYQDSKNSLNMFLPTPFGASNVAPTASGLKAYNSDLSFGPNPISYNYNGVVDNLPSATNPVPSIQSVRARPRHRKQPSYDVVKSVAFELGPNGPKRL